MPENSISPSKRVKSPWFTVMVRWDNMDKLKEISTYNRVPMTQTLARLICADYAAMIERRKEPDACIQNVHTA